MPNSADSALIPGPLIRFHRSRVWDRGCGVLASLVDGPVEMPSFSMTRYALLRRALYRLRFQDGWAMRSAIVNEVRSDWAAEGSSGESLALVDLDEPYEATEQVEGTFGIHLPEAPSMAPVLWPERHWSSLSHVGIVVRARSQEGEMSRSHAFRMLPGWAFVEKHAIAEIEFEAILHESLHNQLNEVLEAEGVPEAALRNGEFFSPWKERLRPRFGFVHACFVFASLVPYWSLIAEDDSRSVAVRSYASRRVREEAIRARQVLGDLRVAAQGLGTGGALALAATSRAASL